MLYRSEKDNMAEKTGIYNRDYHRKIVFPYHLYNINFTRSRFYTDEICHIKKHSTLHKFLESLTFSKVYAAEDVSKKDVPQPAYNRTIPTELLENVARAYIANETGMERINMFFKKNSNDKDSQELGLIKLVILQTLVLSFFMGYVPEWKLAKEDFIRNHRGTVFRTRLEAIRLMQDQVSLRACKAGAILSMKITSFSALFLATSQLIAVYRNKSSVLEYSVAGGLTGGLSRLRLGMKAFVSGSIVGTFLGSVVGGIMWLTFHAFSLKQDQRHLAVIMSKLEPERFVLNDDSFKVKVENCVMDLINAQTQG